MDLNVSRQRETAVFYGHDGESLRFTTTETVRMGEIRYPETSVNNYHTTPLNTPEDRRFQQKIPC